PAEEGLGGARMMVEDGALQGVDAVFGEHVLAFPGTPAGTVATGPGPMLAGMAMFKATFKGKGGHGAMPHLSVDTIVPACHAITSMESIVTKEIDSAMRAVISVGQVHGGTRMNIIADETWFDGSVRFFAPEVAGLVEEKMGRILRSTAEAFRTSVDFQYRKGVPPTVNDQEMGVLAVEVAKRVVGAGKVMPVSPVMGSVDFAYYSERVPGVYVGLSASKGDGKDYPNHHPQFDINEDMLEVGTRLHVEFAKAYLAR
ncbi:MAG: amidohydrolase, partial [Bacillota bacterium]|nr:amidohydrolase [Bacillota bacterium]